jgi:predicted DNA-binding transcriptional regulator YafY
MPHRPFPRPKVPRVGRPSGKFTQHRRLDYLRETLEAHSAGLTLDELASMLRVTTRSVRRYLKELALITELESNEVRPGAAHIWRIKPSERGRAVVLRRTQAYALLALRRVFDVLRGSVLYDEIDVAFRQIDAVAQRPAVRLSVLGDVAPDVHLGERFAFVPPSSRGYAGRSEDIDEIFQAMAQLVVLRFRYRGEGATDPRGTSVVAHPYALILHAGTMSCLGRDVERCVVRAFSFDRMSELEASATDHFELPADFDVKDWLQGDFGIARAARQVRLIVEFEPRAADSVRARRVHPSQKLALASDGRVRVSLVLPETPEVLAQARAWVLGYGSAARVVEPREFLDEVARELRRALGRYTS